jgi:hypothetical protein
MIISRAQIQQNPASSVSADAAHESIAENSVLNFATQACGRAFRLERLHQLELAEESDIQ